MKNITQVRYVVQNEDQGPTDVDVGSILNAYVVGGDDLRGPVLIFHPKNKGIGASCACLEIGELWTVKKIDGMPVFSSSGPDKWANLTAQQSKMYEDLVVNAGFEIPKNQLLGTWEWEPQKSSKKMRR